MVWTFSGLNQLATGGKQEILTEDNVLDNWIRKVSVCYKGHPLEED